MSPDIVRRLSERQSRAQYLAAKSADRIDRRRAKGQHQLVREAFELMVKLDRIGFAGQAPR